MKKGMIYSGVLAAMSLLLLTSCYPEKYEDIEDLDIVQTQYDDEFDFNSKSYFLLADTVPIISEDSGYEKSPEEILMDNAIVGEVADQMTQAGYTQLSQADTADNEKMDDALVLLVSRATESYTEYYYDYYNYGYNYWDGFYGLDYYYPGYYWRNYYPWGYPVSFSYSVGTVIIEMLDPSAPYELNDGEEEVSFPVRWMAVLNGLAELSYENTEDRILDGINQAFEQSPYLY